MSQHTLSQTPSSTPDAAPIDPGKLGGFGRIGVVIAGVVLCAGLGLLSLFIGSGKMGIADSWAALQGQGAASDVLIVQSFRIPRTFLALLVGAALGTAGALIQALTRNPLADPGILGVNAGAYLCVVIGAGVLGIGGTTGQVWCALFGALVVSIAVFLIGNTGPHGGNPVQLVLAGVAIGAVLGGISSAITLLNPEVFDKIRYWAAGSLQGRQIEVLTSVLPFILIGLLIAVALAKQLNSLALGDDLARALGVRVVLIRSIGFVAIMLLCGAATAAAGPLSFIGLMVPHAVRSLVGPDQRWVIPLCMVFGPVLVLAADVLGRVLLGSELPVGIVVAFVGAPVLIWLVRRSEAKTL